MNDRYPEDRYSSLVPSNRSGHVPSSFGDSGYPVSGAGANRPAMRIGARDTHVDAQLTDVIEKLAIWAKTTDKDVYLRFSGGSFGGQPAPRPTASNTLTSPAIKATWQPIRGPIPASPPVSFTPANSGGITPKELSEKVEIAVCSCAIVTIILGAPYSFWCGLHDKMPFEGILLPVWHFICSFF